MTTPMEVELITSDEKKNFASSYTPCAASLGEGMRSRGKGERDPNPAAARDTNRDTGSLPASPPSDTGSACLTSQPAVG